MFLRPPQWLAWMVFVTACSVCALGHAKCDAKATAAAGTLQALGCELGGVIGATAKAPTLVVSSPVAGIDDPARAAELGVRLARVIASAFGAGTTAASEAAPLGVARAIARNHGRFLYLDAKLNAGQLQVAADVYPVARGLWQRVRDPRPPAESHAFAQRRIDAEVTSFLPPVPLVAKRVDKARAPSSGVVAAACADVDADAALELLLVTRHHIQMGRLRAQRFVSQASANWSELSAIAPVPLRQPLASLQLGPQGILVGLTDRADTVRLSPRLELLASYTGQLPWPHAGCSKRVGLGASAAATPCEGQGDVEATGFDFEADALAAAWLWDRQGLGRQLFAARKLGTHELQLRDGARKAVLSPVGAQVALGDLDRDGQIEVVVGSDTLDPEQDAVIVYTWLATGTLIERFRIGIPGGVQALAVCPPEDTGPSPAIVVSKDQIWVIR